MKFANRTRILFIALVIGTIMFGPGVGAQDEGWRIIHAEYGYRTQRADVTSLLSDLIARGGDSGQIYVNDGPLGGDPAQGHEKTLYVRARNRNGQERVFEYKQHSFLDVRLYDVRRGDRDDRPNGDRDRDRDRGDSDLRIIGAYYGVQGQTVNVTDLLRSRVRDRMLSFVVTNGALGGDPAAGVEKVLIVVYRYRGMETATAVREGYQLTIP
ncbi:MAG TPA: hypothetical protein VJO16_03180 [Candidatus Acidoferrum sp.]|nr:hypothetical protein [Candidatus Acidoferrum sp.]